jgi:hypothetical protein
MAPIVEIMDYHREAAEKRRFRRSERWLLDAHSLKAVALEFSATRQERMMRKKLNRCIRGRDFPGGVHVPAREGSAFDPL